MRELIDLLLTHPNEANAIAAVANTLVAFFAFVIAGASVILSIRSNRNQIKHNKLSVRPVPYVALSKHNGVSAELQNHGFGPFKIEHFEVSRDGEVLQNISSIIPSNPPAGVTVSFHTGMWGRTIPVDAKICLLAVTLTNGAHDSTAYLNECQVNLMGCIITILYSDIYDQNFDPSVHDLNWLSIQL